MTNKELYEMCEPKSVIRGTLEELGRIQAEVIEEPLSVKNQMIMTGIAYSIAQYKHDFKGDFEKEFAKELKFLEYQHEQFYYKNQEHINN